MARPRKLIIWLLLGFFFTGTPLLFTQVNVFDFRASISTVIQTPSTHSLYQVVNREISFGSYTIPIRIYYPSDEIGLPAIYHIHGGAWVAGNLDTHDQLCRYLAQATQSVVIAIHYRRPPEYSFPVAVEDCFVVLNWITENRSSLRISSHLTLIGDSAGAGLAATLSYLNHQVENPVPIRGQILVNPALDLRKQSNTYQVYQFFIDTYVREGTSQDHPLLIPFMEQQPKDFPATAIVVGEKDEIKADGINYYQLLLRHQVSVDLFEQAAVGHFAGSWTAMDDSIAAALRFVQEQILAWR